MPLDLINEIEIGSLGEAAGTAGLLGGFQGGMANDRRCRVSQRAYKYARCIHEGTKEAQVGRSAGGGSQTWMREEEEEEEEEIEEHGPLAMDIFFLYLLPILLSYMEQEQEQLLVLLHFSCVVLLLKGGGKVGKVGGQCPASTCGSPEIYID